MSESRHDDVETYERALWPVAGSQLHLGDGSLAGHLVPTDGSGPDIRNDDSAESRT